MLKAVAPILDLVKFDIREASVNTFPFPVTLYSGTQIMGGIYFNVEYFNFFGLIKARRVMVHFSPAEGIFDLQIFVDPMKLEIGGITLLEITGVNSDEKFAARALIEEKKAKRAEEAKKARIEMQKIQAELHKSPPPAPTCPKAAETCKSCTRVLAQRNGKIDCGKGRGYVISKILDAYWGVAGLDLRREARPMRRRVVRSRNVRSHEVHEHEDDRARPVENVRRQGAVLLDSDDADVWQNTRRDAVAGDVALRHRGVHAVGLVR